MFTLSISPFTLHSNPIEVVLWTLFYRWGKPHTQMDTHRDTHTHTHTHTREFSNLPRIILLEENIGKTLSNINHSRILYDPPPRILEIKAKINK